MSSSATILAFSRAAFLLSCAWIALSIWATVFILDFGTTLNTLRYLISLTELQVMILW